MKFEPRITRMTPMKSQKCFRFFFLIRDIRGQNLFFL